MRIQVSIPVSIALVALLCACGKSGGDTPKTAGAGGPVSGVPAPPAPAAPTEAQKKAALASLPPAYRAADIDNGEAKFALCRSCHTAVRDGPDMTGPNLYDVFGRRAGTKPGFAYSDALKISKIVWDADSIDNWIANPRADVPGTKMTYLGMESPKDRIDLIAYLKLVTTPKGRLRPYAS
ncbi:MAG: cytochrome c family protein [Pseudomonadota bacterium]|nr:cytochrome c family protein [Pseudomonadota bacterium]